ncbi:MAG: S-adenosylmethionine:tRNA ribosyltransferase-isomerase [Bacteroidales bacterium]|jgi:S-adenosylmethionine:tRNA ribosyltransferase-isomerase|nr:S-adenosylmethionine:tRNA ribosyltransferase-isomerase [Bacteroidales bacterium]
MVYKQLDIAIDDFDYNLPQERIASFPLKKRDEAKLLVLDKDRIYDIPFYEFPNEINKDSLLIFNDTKVIFARLFFNKPSGAQIEIFCLEPFEIKDIQIAFAQRKSVLWKCFIGNNRKWKEGQLVKTAQYKGETISLKAEKVKPEEDSWIVRFSWNGNHPFCEILSIMGIIPLPPYLNRKAESEDNIDYQTIYANLEGSVAAPTAGLHFTKKTFSDLKQRGIKTDFITLHVGAGTFKPVTTQSIKDHSMHAEQILITKSVIEDLISYIDKNIICIGTTSVRSIESLYWYGVSILENKDIPLDIDILQWQPYQKECSIPAKDALNAILERMNRGNINYISGKTQIIIAPSYTFRIVSGLVTNFHQPKSTLLLLVSALIGDKWKDCYNYALENKFRFLSFGDACYFTKG